MESQARKFALTSELTAVDSQDATSPTGFVCE